MRERRFGVFFNIPQSDKNGNNFANNLVFRRNRFSAMKKEQIRRQRERPFYGFYYFVSSGKGMFSFTPWNTWKFQILISVKQKNEDENPISFNPGI